MYADSRATTRVAPTCANSRTLPVPRPVVVRGVFPRYSVHQRDPVDRSLSSQGNDAWYFTCGGSRKNRPRAERRPSFRPFSWAMQEKGQGNRGRLGGGGDSTSWLVKRSLTWQLYHNAESRLRVFGDEIDNGLISCFFCPRTRRGPPGARELRVGAAFEIETGQIVLAPPDRPAERGGLK